MFSEIGRKSVISSNNASWIRRWMVLTFAASFLMTGVDTVLLQKKTGFLTGGFLSYFYLQDTEALLSFIVSSLICDSGILGVLILLTFFSLRYWKVRRRLWEFTALLVGIFPLFILDFIKYRLEVYVGDIFKLVTLFDLTGKNPWEFLAVSYSHILFWLILLVFLVVTVVFTFMRVKREKAEAIPPLISFRTLCVTALAFLTVSTIYSTIARLNSEQLDHVLRRKPSGLVMGLVVNRLSDFDGDGFGLLAKPADPAPFNPEIYPYAFDIPGNGVDENGEGGDLPLVKSVYQENLSIDENWGFKPNVIFIMLESFRADLIGSKLEGQYVTPVINLLAKNGISSKSAYSHNGYTSQSRYHSLTGEFPGHRKSMVDSFKKNKYFVSFFSAQDVSFGGKALRVGFEDADFSYDARVEPHLRFNAFSTPGSISLSNQVIKRKVLNFLASYSNDKPLFLYVNFQDTHFPYWNGDLHPILNSVKVAKGNILPQKKDELLLMYKNSAANVDSAIGEILQEVKKRLNGDVAVVILSDHGESLFDDGFLGHGYTLNDHQTRIPLVISGLPAVLEEPFGQVDLRAIINKALRLEKTAGAKPIIVKNPEKMVFQYIGDLEKPGQIGFIKQNKRLVYDFRQRSVKDWNDEWKNPSELSVSSRSDLNELIHLWESIIIANQKGELSF